MITKEEALTIARQTLASRDHRDPDVVVVEDETRVTDYGWVFFYQTERYLRTGELGAMLVGNGPILVLRDGSVHRLPSNRSPGDSLHDFEVKHGFRPYIRAVERERKRARARANAEFMARINSPEKVEARRREGAQHAPWWRRWFGA